MAFHCFAALILADEGYDVWIGNTRGGTGSRNHTSLDADVSISYWQYRYSTTNDICIYTQSINIRFNLISPNGKSNSQRDVEKSAISLHALLYLASWCLPCSVHEYCGIMIWIIFIFSK